jgi:hypothetical protein
MSDVARNEVIEKAAETASSAGAQMVEHLKTHKTEAAVTVAGAALLWAGAPLIGGGLLVARGVARIRENGQEARGVGGQVADRVAGRGTVDKFRRDVEAGVAPTLRKVSEKAEGTATVAYGALALIDKVFDPEEPELEVRGARGRARSVPPARARVAPPARVRVRPR